MKGEKRRVTTTRLASSHTRCFSQFSLVRTPVLTQHTADHRHPSSSSN